MRPRECFQTLVAVRFDELDPLRHVNNAVYLAWLEQAAIDHAERAGWSGERQRELGGVFIARRHEIDYLQPATQHDVLLVTTWVDSLTGARAIRSFEIARVTAECAIAIPFAGRLIPAGDFSPASRANAVLRARTEWAFVDVTTGRPRRIPTECIADFVFTDDTAGPESAAVGRENP
jgi:acyl-CoA thioester hydrolase